MKKTKKLSNKKKVSKKKVVVKSKKVAKRAAKAKVEKSLRQTQGKPIGVVTHFYGGIKVAVVKCKAPIKAGTAVTIRGATTDFSQTIESLQYNHASVKIAKKGQSIGMKVKKRVREGDEVYVNNKS